jgi:hypothetical protein
MLTIRRSITALLAITAIGATACSKDAVTGASASRVNLDIFAPVYSQDFSAPVGAEWSNQLESTAPGGEKFLGEFSNEATTLSLTGLAAHDSVTVSLDLYIIRSWDGTDPDWGTDNMTITADGVSLLNTSFANTDGSLQNYPDALGGSQVSAQTGAFAVNSLGFTYWGGQPIDATYRLTFKFAHSSSSLTLALAALGLQNITDESWGIDNVVVSIGQ